MPVAYCNQILQAQLHSSAAYKNCQLIESFDYCYHFYAAQGVLSGGHFITKRINFFDSLYLYGQIKK